MEELSTSASTSTEVSILKEQVVKLEAQLTETIDLVNIEELEAFVKKPLLAAQAREVRAQEALRSHQDRARCVTALLTVP